MCKTMWNECIEVYDQQRCSSGLRPGGITARDPKAIRALLSLQDDGAQLLKSVDCWQGRSLLGRDACGERQIDSYPSLLSQR